MCYDVHMAKEILSPETAYATSPNIVHPQSNRGSAGDAHVAAAESAARQRIIDAKPQLTVTAATIKKGR